MRVSVRVLMLAALAVGFGCTSKRDDGGLVGPSVLRPVQAGTAGQPKMLVRTQD